MFDGMTVSSITSIGMMNNCKWAIRYDTIRYDTGCYFNVRSKAELISSALSTVHGTKN